MTDDTHPAASLVRSLVTRLDELDVIDAPDGYSVQRESLMSALISCPDCGSKEVSPADDDDTLVCDNCGHEFEPDHRINYKSPVEPDDDN